MHFPVCILVCISQYAFHPSICSTPPGFICLKYKFLSWPDFYSQGFTIVTTMSPFLSTSPHNLPCKHVFFCCGQVFKSSLKAPTSVGFPVPANFNQLRDLHSLHTFRSKFFPPGHVSSVSLTTLPTSGLQICLSLSRVSVSKLGKCFARLYHLFAFWLYSSGVFGSLCALLLSSLFLITAS